MNKKTGFKGIIIGLIIVLCASFLSGCFGEKEKPKEQEDVAIEKEEPAKKQEENATQKEEKIFEEDENGGVFEGDMAYDFTLLDPEGNEIKLSDLRGKIVYLNFWTTNNAIEMPRLEEVYSHYKDKDVVILGVNVLAAEKREMTEVNEYLDEHGYTFPVLYDVDGAVSQKYRISTFPTTYIIQRDGKIIRLITQPMDRETMIEKIEEALNE